MPTTTQNLPIAALTIHPRLAEVAMMADTAEFFRTNHHGDAQRREWADDISGDWNAFVESVRENGILEPLKAIALPDGKWSVIDGRHRLKAAELAGLEKVPCTVIDPTKAEAVIMSSVFARRQWTKSQKAWFAVLMHPLAPIGRPKKPQVDPIMGQSPHSLRTFSTSELAAKAGVSDRLIEYARQISAAFEKSPTLKAKLEPSIWAGAELPAIAAGIAGAAATQGGPRLPSGHASVDRTLSSLGRQLRDFAEWPVEEREALATVATAWAAAIPAAAADILRHALAQTANAA